MLKACESISRDRGLLALIMHFRFRDRGLFALIMRFRFRDRRLFALIIHFRFRGRGLKPTPIASLSAYGESARLAP